MLWGRWAALFDRPDAAEGDTPTSRTLRAGPTPARVSQLAGADPARAWPLRGGLCPSVRRWSEASMFTDSRRIKRRRSLAGSWVTRRTPESLEGRSIVGSLLTAVPGLPLIPTLNWE